VPLVESDAALHPKLAKLLQNDHWGGVFMPAKSAICFRVGTLDCEFVTGCYSIHEANHAQLAIQQGRYGDVHGLYDASDEEQYQEEVRVTTLERDLWRERDPGRFGEAVTTLVTWARSANPVNSDVEVPMHDIGIPDLLERFLGPAPHPKATRARLSRFVRFAEFQMIDESDSPNKLQEKMDIIRRSYAELKLLQEG
jgi:hypothetical protein